jgi:proteasome lid subunit RPN8/RPN11
MPPVLRLLVPRSVYEAMLAQARAEAPQECCGLLGGTVAEDGTALAVVRYPLVNTARNPATEYLSDDAVLFAAYRDMRSRKIDLIAVYHSHPTSRPVPSRKDLAMNYSGPDVANLILSLVAAPLEVRCWRLRAEDYEEIPWEVIDSG